MAEGGNFKVNEPGRLLNTRPTGKLVTLAVWGEFDGATVKLQIGFAAPDNSLKWMDLGEYGLFDDDGLTNVLVKANYFRLVVHGAGANTNINWWLG